MLSLLDSMGPADVTVHTSDLLVATAQQCDPLLDASVQRALRMLRQMLKLDAVFVAEMVDGAPVARAGDGELIALDQAYCRQVLEGRRPGSLPDVDALAGETSPQAAAPGPRSPLMAQVVRRDGSVYGTLGCLAASPLAAEQERTLLNLRRSAQYVADALDAAVH